MIRPLHSTPLIPQFPIPSWAPERSGSSSMTFKRGRHPPSPLRFTFSWRAPHSPEHATSPPSRVCAGWCTPRGVTRTCVHTAGWGDRYANPQILPHLRGRAKSLRSCHRRRAPSPPSRLGPPITYFRGWCPHSPKLATGPTCRIHSGVHPSGEYPATPMGRAPHRDYPGTRTLLDPPSIAGPQGATLTAKSGQTLAGPLGGGVMAYDDNPDPQRGDALSTSREGSFVIPRDAVKAEVTGASAHFGKSCLGTSLGHSLRPSSRR